MDKIIQAFQDDGAEWLYPIVFFLVAGLAIAFERIYFVAVRSNINGVSLMSLVKNAIMNQKYQEAIKTCNAEEQKGKVLPKVLKAGLQKAETGTPEEIKAAMEQATLEVYPATDDRIYPAADNAGITVAAYGFLQVTVLDATGWVGNEGVIGA